MLRYVVVGSGYRAEYFGRIARTWPELFMALREGGLLDNAHVGGCVLYEQRDRVEKLLAGETV